MHSGPFRPAADLNSIVASQDVWLVPNFIPRNSVVVLASAPKTGKTCFATALGRALATGQPFLGQPLPRTPVLWCSHEESPVERIHLHEGLTLEDPFFIAYISDLPPLPHRIGKPDRYGRRDMREFDPPFVFEHALTLGAKLIIIDCLHAAVEGLCLADNASARAIMSILRTWSHHLGISVLVLHHLTKGGSRSAEPERFADSTQILATASCYFFLERHERENGEHHIVITGKGRHPAPVARMELTSTGPLDYRASQEEYVPTRRSTAGDRVRDLLAEGWSLTTVEIARKLRLAPSTVRCALLQLQEQGFARQGEMHFRAPRYELNPASATEGPKPENRAADDLPT